MSSLADKDSKHGHEVAWVQSAHEDATSKSSLYSGKEDDEQDNKELPDELDKASVWLDNIKDDNSGSKIIRRGTDEVLYTFSRAHRWTKPSIDIFHGEASQEVSERDHDCIPIASIKTGWSGQIRLRYQPDKEAEPIDLTRREFLKSRKWWGMPELFECDGIPYRLRMPMWNCHGKTILTAANDESKTPLCVMRPSKNPFGPIRPSIEILPNAVATSSTPKEHALLLDDHPTKLLDLAVAADHVYRLYLNQLSAASASSSSAASSSAAAAVAA